MWNPKVQDEIAKRVFVNMVDLIFRGEAIPEIDGKIQKDASKEDYYVCAAKESIHAAHHFDVELEKHKTGKEVTGSRTFEKPFILSDKKVDPPDFDFQIEKLKKENRKLWDIIGRIRELALNEMDELGEEEIEEWRKIGGGCVWDEIMAVLCEL